MISIDKLIYDALVGRRSVVLPGEGTLEVKWRGAKRISDKQMIPPQNVVAFTPGASDEAAEGSENIVSIIAAAGVDRQEAEAIYGSWLGSARRADGTIVIDGVGETGKKGFSMSEGLRGALNVTESGVVGIETEKRSRHRWIYFVIGLLALLALCALFLCKKNGGFPWGGPKKAPVETVAVVPPPPAADAAPVTAAPVRPAGPRFHVIAGAFEIESNADNYIARLKREYPELTLEKVLHLSNGYNMVSVIQAPTRREASRGMNLYWDIDPCLWIYQQD